MGRIKIEGDDRPNYWDNPNYNIPDECNLNKEDPNVQNHDKRLQSHNRENNE